MEITRHIKSTEKNPNKISENINGKETNIMVITRVIFYIIINFSISISTNAGDSITNPKM